MSTDGRMGRAPLRRAPPPARAMCVCVLEHMPRHHALYQCIDTPCFACPQMRASLACVRTSPFTQGPGFCARSFVDHAVVAFLRDKPAPPSPRPRRSPRNRHGKWAPRQCFHVPPTPCNHTYLHSARCVHRPLRAIFTQRKRAAPTSPTSSRRSGIASRRCADNALTIALLVNVHS